MLLNEDCTIKLCDFGLARQIDGIGDLTETILNQVDEEIVDIDGDNQMEIFDKIKGYISDQESPNKDQMMDISSQSGLNLQKKKSSSG